MNKEKILQFYNTHRGGINGALIGVSVACFILIFGFFRALFIAIFAAIGYYVGKKLSEDREYLKNLLDRVLPPGTYR